MEQAAADRRYAELHEKRPFHDGTFSRWSEKATGATPYHFNDGVTLFVAETDLNPGDQFLSEPSVLDEAPDDRDQAGDD